MYSRLTICVLVPDCELCQREVEADLDDWTSLHLEGQANRAVCRRCFNCHRQTEDLQAAATHRMLVATQTCCVFIPVRLVVLSVYRVLVSAQ